MDVEPLVARFNRWDISTCVLNTASLGNAIAIFRLEILVDSLRIFLPPSCVYLLSALSRLRLSAPISSIFSMRFA